MHVTLSKDELLLFLKEKLATSRSCLRSSLQSKIHKEALIYYTSFLPIDSKLSQRSWHVLHDVNHQPTCKTCQQKVPKFNNNKWDYLEYCSVKCQRNSSIVISKLQTSLQKRYGEGITNAFQADDVRKKSKNTMLRKHGVDHNTKSIELQAKRSEISMQKWGVDHPSKLEAVKLRIKLTLTNKYGVDSFSKTQEFKDKCKATWILHYGVDHPFKQPQFIDSFLEKIHKCKDYELPSGRIIKIMGYEDRALDELLKIYNEDDICYTKQEIRELTGIITYTSHTGRKRTYFPDFYIKKTNTIVEVKSTWTYDRNGKQNPLENENFRKKDACLQMGFNFQFMIM